MRRSARFLLLVLAILLARPLSANLPLDTVKDRKARETLRKIGLQIILGESLRGMVNANSYGWEIFHKGESGRQRELAYSLALQGLAELQLKMNREAFWHWESAQILLPELHAQLMHSYSELTKVLDSTPMRSHDTAVEWLRQEGELAEGENVRPPELVDRSSAVAPRRKPESLSGQRVTVVYLVDTDGYVQAPKLVGEPASDLAVFSALQALMSWRYLPARKNGELAWSVQTTSFSFQPEG